MQAVAASHPPRRTTRVGRGRRMGDFLGRDMRAGNDGDGGGEEKRRWLKLKREDVAERGPCPV